MSVRNYMSCMRRIAHAICWNPSLHVMIYLALPLGSAAREITRSMSGSRLSNVAFVCVASAKLRSFSFPPVHHSLLALVSSRSLPGLHSFTHHVLSLSAVVLRTENAR